MRAPDAVYSVRKYENWRVLPRKKHRRALQEWALLHDLRYEASGEFPLYVVGRDIEDEQRRWAPQPMQWGANLCSGSMPGNFEGRLGHRSTWVYIAEESGGWQIDTDTRVIARCPEGARLARTISAALTNKRRGRQSVEWDADPQEAADLVASGIEPAVATAFAELSADAWLVVEWGWVQVIVDGIVWDPSTLDAMCHAAGAVADALRAEAARHRSIEPGHGALPAPPDTEERRELLDEVARVDWVEPPEDAQAGFEAYEPIAGDAPPGEDAGSGRAAWHRLKRVAGRNSRRERAAQLAEEAFIQGYARARQLREEDPEFVRLHLPLELPGHPYRSLFGPAPATGDRPSEMRLIWWHGALGASGEPRDLRLALVPAPPGFIPTTNSAYEAYEDFAPPGGSETLLAGSWLVVAADFTDHVDSVSGLDNLIAAATAASQ